MVKVEQVSIKDKTKFEPVVVVLETEQELATFFNAVNYCGKHYLDDYEYAGQNKEQYHKERRKFWEKISPLIKKGRY